MSSPSTRVTRLAAVVLASLAVLLGTVLAASAAGGSVRLKPGAQQLAGPGPGNPVPNVVRSLRGWSCGRGILTLSHGPRIVAGSADETVLADVARTLSGDLADVTGLTVPVVSAPWLRGGGIFLSLQSAESQAPPGGGQSHVS
jgi:hypothetical protein